MKNRLCRKLCSANTFRHIISPRPPTLPLVMAGSTVLQELYYWIKYSPITKTSVLQPRMHKVIGSQRIIQSLTWLLNAPQALVMQLQERDTSQAWSPAGLACTLPAPEQPWLPTVLLEKFPRNPNQFLSLSIFLRNAFISRFAERYA